MKQRWLATLVGGAALTAIGATNALAADNTVVVPAPPSEASATALQLKGLLTIGQTAARSAQDSGSASATALGIGGNSLVQGKTGGSQSGDGKQAGALIELEKGPLAENGTDVEVTPWDAAVSGPNSDARAALARVGVGGVVRVDVLHSKSHTTYTQGKSTGTSSSDGVRLCLLGCSDKDKAGGLEIVVLHSEAESGGTGHSYVAKIGDTRLVSDEDLGNPNDVCSLTVGEQPSQVVFLQALCVSAKGGTGAEQRNEATASVANATLLGDMIAGNLITASGSGGLAPIAAPAPVPAPPEIVQGAAEVPAALPEAAPRALAATGGVIMWGLLAGLITLLLGAALLFAGRLRGLAGSRS